MTFEDEWARCSPWIQDALDHAGNTHTLEDVEAMVRLHDARFWAGRGCAVVTEVHEFPAFKTVHVWLAGGDMLELASEMHDQVEAWGKAAGCAKMTLAGRQGWARVLAKNGHRVMATVIGKDLT